jgi:tetratricopeptide (TPR) repeat protein
LALEPENLVGHQLRGVSRASLGHHEEALTDFDQVLKVESDNTDAMRMRGKSLFMIRKYEEAVDQFSEVLALEPHDVSTLRMRGLILEILGRHAEAKDDLDRVLEIDPEDAIAADSRFAANVWLGRYEDAIANVDQVRGQSQANLVLQSNEYGLLLSYLGRYSEAVAVYRDIPGWQQSATTLYNIAVVMVRWKGRQESQADVDRAWEALLNLDETEHQAELHYGLAGLSALMGNDESALHHLEQALDVPRVFDWVRQDIAWTHLRDDVRFQELIGRKATQP